MFDSNKCMVMVDIKFNHSPAFLNEGKWVRRGYIRSCALANLVWSGYLLEEAKVTI